MAKYVKLECNTFRPDIKLEKAIKVKKAYKFVKKPTGEGKVFEKIWNERPHKSQISGEVISEPKAINFLHVLAKGNNKYPEFKLLSQNIVLGTEKEHDLWDNFRYKIKSDPKWAFMFELEYQLKMKYEKEYGNLFKD